MHCVYLSEIQDMPSMLSETILFILEASRTMLSSVMQQWEKLNSWRFSPLTIDAAAPSSTDMQPSVFSFASRGQFLKKYSITVLLTPLQKPMLRDSNIGMYWEKTATSAVVRSSLPIKFSFFNELALEIILHKEVDGISLSLLKSNSFHRLGSCPISYHCLHTGITCKLSSTTEKKLKILKITSLGRWLNETNSSHVSSL